MSGEVLARFVRPDGGEVVLLRRGSNYAVRSSGAAARLFGAGLPARAEFLRRCGGTP